MGADYAVTVLGAGKIGRALARVLHFGGGFAVRVADVAEGACALVRDELGIPAEVLDVADEAAVTAFLAGQRAVVSACSYDVNPGIARAALAAGCSYFDLTEDVATTRAVRAVAERAVADQVFMPQCGLAPGYIGILAHDLCRSFDRLDKVRMRVGALPLYPANMLKYNLTWSTDGLINEYCNPCEALRDGKRVELQALEGLEHFALDGVDYEAFNTSGGLGTLCETLGGQCRELDYKTVRYRGHRELMHFLVNGLGMRDRRELLKELLEGAVPATEQDVVLIFAVVTGWRGGRLEQVADARKVYHSEIAGQQASSIKRTTAGSMAAVLDLHRSGKLPERGFVRQEDVALADLEASPFAAPYVEATRVRSPIARARQAEDEL